MKIGILDFRVLRRFNPFSKHYDKVVSSNTNGTDSTAEHGAIPEGDDRYNGGVYANGHIYFIPWSADNVYKINVVTKVVSLAVTIVLPSKAYASGVLAPNGKIYCIPFSASDILVINPTDDSFYTIPVDAGTLKWQCGSINEDGVIYCIPRTNANVLKIDTRDDTITEFGGIAGTAKWAGAVLVGHYIYGIPYRSTTVLKIDIRDDSFTTFGVVSSDNDKWFDGALLENGFIYGCPSSAGAILKINPADDTLSSFGSFPTIQTWRGITNGGNGSLYCAVNGLLGQNNTSQTLEITNDGVVNFISEEFIKSAYYNKL